MEPAPKWIRCYDNGGKTIDRYTVVFTRGKGSLYLGMSSNPMHPQGIGMHGEGPPGSGPIDRPTYGHLGKRIVFEQLPDDCQKIVRATYSDLWKKID